MTEEEEEALGRRHGGPMLHGWRRWIRGRQIRGDGVGGGRPGGGQVAVRVRIGSGRGERADRPVEGRGRGGGRWRRRHRRVPEALPQHLVAGVAQELEVAGVAEREHGSTLGARRPQHLAAAVGERELAVGRDAQHGLRRGVGRGAGGRLLREPHHGLRLRLGGVVVVYSEAEPCGEEEPAGRVGVEGAEAEAEGAGRAGDVVGRRQGGTRGQVGPRHGQRQETRLLQEHER